mmetsp:Transcript_12956/g.28145  ORF Transcript_12956/g.28145 Transcript_12956/m.28145 type:complete len:333 (-) Transcript_12956:1359-2357(-)
MAITRESMECNVDRMEVRSDRPQEFSRMLEMRSMSTSSTCFCWAVTWFSAFCRCCCCADAAAAACISAACLAACSSAACLACTAACCCCCCCWRSSSSSWRCRCAAAAAADAFASASSACWLPKPPLLGASPHGLLDTDEAGAPHGLLGTAAASSPGSDSSGFTSASAAAGGVGSPPTLPPLDASPVPATPIIFINRELALLSVFPLLMGALPSSPSPFSPPGPSSPKSSKTLTPSPLPLRIVVPVLANGLLGSTSWEKDSSIPPRARASSPPPSPMLLIPPSAAPAASPLSPLSLFLSLFFTPPCNSFSKSAAALLISLISNASIPVRPLG